MLCRVKLLLLSGTGTTLFFFLFPSRSFSHFCSPMHNNNVSWRSLSHASPYNFQLKIILRKIIKSPFQVHYTISSCCYLKSLRNPFKSQLSRFRRVLRLQLLQTKPNRPLDAIASASHSSSGRFIPVPPFVPCFIHRHCSLSSSFSESWFLFYLPNFFSFAQFNSVLLCFFVCP